MSVSRVSPRVDFGSKESGVDDAAIDLTGAPWDVSGADASGFLWDGSTLVFDSQTRNHADFDVAGYFDWRCSDGRRGREYFTGVFGADGGLELHGYALEENAGIGLATYTAKVADAASIHNGRWLGAAVGDWTAYRGPRLGPLDEPPDPGADGGDNTGFAAERRKT